MSKKVQVVFLVETPPKDCLKQRRALYLACCRILLQLAQFPNREHPAHLQWSYKLLSPRAPLKSSLLSTAQFHELHSDLLTKFFEELCESSELETPVQSGSLNTWARQLYNALAATVQDFIWDAPEIRTPVRRRSRQKRARPGGKRHKPPSTDEGSPCRNLIFLMSKTLDGGGDETGVKSATIVNQVLPKPLLSQLLQKSISLNWVYFKGARSLSDTLMAALRPTGGMLMPISTFLSPARLRGSAAGSLPPVIPLAAKVKQCLGGGGGGGDSGRLKEDLVWLCSEGVWEGCVRGERGVFEGRGDGGERGV